MITSILTPWLIWFLLAIGMAFLELILPGFILIFFAVGCLLTALVLFFFDPTLTQQILIFIITSLASLILLRKWLMGVFRGKSSDSLAQDFDDFPTGVRVPVLKTITLENNGRIQYRGTTWSAIAEETIEAGTTVEIVKYADNSRQTFFVRTINK